MNINNIDRSIAVLNQMPAQGFNMNTWKCGTVVCFLGALADSPEIPEITWRPDTDLHVPMIEGPYMPLYGSVVLARFLEIDHSTARELSGCLTIYEFYNKPLDEVTPQDVINQLIKLKEQQNES